MRLTVKKLHFRVDVSTPSKKKGRCFKITQYINMNNDNPNYPKIQKEKRRKTLIKPTFFVEKNRFQVRFFWASGPPINGLVVLQKKKKEERRGEIS